MSTLSPSVTEEAIQLREGSNEIGIRKENVARVTVLDKNHRRRNALSRIHICRSAGDLLQGRCKLAQIRDIFFPPNPTCAFESTSPIS